MQQTQLFENVTEAQKVLETNFIVKKKVLNKLITKLHDNPIEDLLVEHDKFQLFASPPNVRCDFYTQEQPQSYRIHRHALGQMCNKTGFPLAYNDYLTKQGEWGAQLACGNLNRLFAKLAFKRQNGAPAQFLVRRIGNEVRGFLSRRYALHLSTVPLLEHFIDYCRQYEAYACEVTASDVRTHVLCVQRYLHEPITGYPIAFGIAFFNSDYGAGSFDVHPGLTNPISGTSLILPAGRILTDTDFFEEHIKKIHLGPMLYEKDLNPTNSERAKRMELASEALRDMIQYNLRPEFAEAFSKSLCRAIAAAHDTKVPWEKLEKSLLKILLKEEVQRIDEMRKAREANLPKLDLDSDGFPIPTNWWASQAISEIAKSLEDSDRTIDLQREAGLFLTKEAS